MLQSTTLPSPNAAPMVHAPRGIGAQEMAEHEMLVRWVVRQQRLGGLPFEDALHEGRIGLWAALRRYDPQRGTAFSTYAVPAITHAVWRAVSLYHHQQQQQPSPVLHPPSIAPDLSDLVHRSQVEATLHDLVDQLPPRWRQIIVEHYGLGDDATKSPTGDALPQSFASIARHSSVSRQRIHHLHLKAILWLAHPAHSLPLRLLLERHDRADYQQSAARQRRLARRWRRSSQAPSVKREKKEEKAGPKRGGRAR